MQVFLRYYLCWYLPTYFSMKIELNTFENAKTLRYILIMLLQKGSDLIVPVSAGLQILRIFVND